MASYYDAENNIVYHSILRPFYKAGRRYGWRTDVGLGIPKDTFDLTMKRMAALQIFVEEENRTYHVSHDKLAWWSRNNKFYGWNGKMSIAYIEEDITTLKKNEV